MESDAIFNPLDKHNLGNSVADALLKTEAYSFDKIITLRGAGIYAIYYLGDFEPYQALAELNRAEATYPIYVGKAIPKGGRKGGTLDSSLDSTALSRRLLEHKSTIEAAPSLKITDFQYRCLVVDDIWIPLGETLIIQRFQPLWNHVVEGFGNHDPGGGRYGGMRPLWDELHPGRSWAQKCQAPKKMREQILRDVTSYMEKVIRHITLHVEVDPLQPPVVLPEGGISDSLSNENT